MERSPWTLSMMAATLLLLSGSLLVPWFSFHHSTGRQTPPGSDSGDDGVEEREIHYRPFAVEGDTTAEQEREGAEATLVLGVIVTVAAFFALVNVFIEVFWGIREGTRVLQMVLVVLGFLAAGTALAYAWIVLPELLRDEGVTKPFTSRNDQGTFVRSTISWGWVAAALSLVANAASFALKFAGGVFSLSFLDQYRSEPR